MGPSFWQLMIVLAIVLLLFGTKRLRNLGGDLGGAIKGFKKAMGDEEKTAAEEKSKVEQQKPENVIDVTPEKKKDQV
ncbi:MAG: twin-arginine translocase TatA/TatE family subunit [Gammaproteobacteria bacterium]|nr:twin-arginine translocase TatA/TatE family subunit [Gammaproteobacteria bacterium]